MSLADKIFQDLAAEQVSPLASPGGPSPLGQEPQGSPAAATADQNAGWDEWIQAQVAAGDEEDQQEREDTQVRAGDAEEASESVYTPETSAGSEMLLKASFLKDPRARMRQYAKARDLPASRYKIIDGRPAYQGEDGQWYAEESPPNSMIKWGGTLDENIASMTGNSVGVTTERVQRTAGGVGDALPDLAGAAAGGFTAPWWATGPGGAMASVAVTGAVQGAVEMARQGIAEALFDEEEDSQLDPAAVAEETAIGAGGQAIFGAGARVGRAVIENLPPWAKKMPRKVLERIMGDPEARRIAETAHREGVPMTPAEISNAPELVGPQSAAGAVPKGRPYMEEHYAAVSTQSAEMANRMLDRMAPDADPYDVGKAAVDAAGGVMDRAATIRRKRTKPLYDAVLQPTNTIGPAGFGTITRDPFLRDRVSKVMGDPLADVATHAPESLTVLHRVRRSIAKEHDQALKEGKGELAIDLGKKHEILETVLNTEYPAYALANRAYAFHSKAVNELHEHAIGQIARMKGSGSKEAAVRLMTEKKITPREAQAAMHQITRENPSTAQSIKRAWLAGQWERAVSVGTGKALNSGLKFRNAVFGNAKQRKIIESVLSPKEVRGLSDAADVVASASRVRPTGLDVRRMSLVEDMSRDAAGAFGRFAGGGSKAESVSLALRFLNSLRSRGRLSTLAKAITDPRVPEQFAQLKLLRPGSEKWVVAVGQLAQSMHRADQASVAE